MYCLSFSIHLGFHLFLTKELTILCLMWIFTTQLWINLPSYHCFGDHFLHPRCHLVHDNGPQGTHHHSEFCLRHPGFLQQMNHSGPYLYNWLHPPDLRCLIQYDDDHYLHHYWRSQHDDQHLHCLILIRSQPDFKTHYNAFNYCELLWV